MDLRTARVVVTGGRGFLGAHVVERLFKAGCDHVAAIGSADFDLVDREATRLMYRELQPDVVLHLAARVGGIGANQQNPGKYFYDNLQMGLNVIEEGRLAGARKIVVAGTICAYPKHTAVPFREEELWNGYPEETNAPYGIAKKALLVMAQAYRQQYGLNTVVLFPVNLYGPKDNFDLSTSHVIPAMIRKCIEAADSGADHVTFWGDGSPTREFLYVDDCADGLIMAAERYDDPDPVNLGAGFEITMKSLGDLIARLTGFAGKIVWDTSKPNGQPRRMLDTTRAKARFGFTAKMGLEDGLRRTIQWYREQQAERR